MGNISLPSRLIRLKFIDFLPTNPALPYFYFFASITSFLLLLFCVTYFLHHLLFASLTFFNRLHSCIFKGLGYRGFITGDIGPVGSQAIRISQTVQLILHVGPNRVELRQRAGEHHLI